MTVRALCFGPLRDITGSSELTLTVASATTAEDVWASLVRDHGQLAAFRPYVRVAINQRYADFADAVATGDEVAFIPPVAGG